MSSLFVTNFARSHCKANELWFGVSPSGISLFVRISSCLCCLLPTFTAHATLAVTGCRPPSRDGLALPQFIPPLHLQGPTGLSPFWKLFAGSERLTLVAIWMLTHSAVRLVSHVADYLQLAPHRPQRNASKRGGTPFPSLPTAASPLSTVHPTLCPPSSLLRRGIHLPRLLHPPHVEVLGGVVGEIAVGFGGRKVLLPLLPHRGRPAAPLEQRAHAVRRNHLHIPISKNPVQNQRTG